ncbi:MAG: hypothetical protein H6R18_198 [Proteobacteria bacterium]|nr:hypothetical protein [Pseudomonadota bacterium]
MSLSEKRAPSFSAGCFTDDLPLKTFHGGRVMKVAITIIAGLVCLAVEAFAADQGQDCNPKNKRSADCSGKLVCRSVGNERGVWTNACVGRGLAGDLCAYEDRGKGSDTCGGNLLCRLPAGQPYTLCFARGSLQQNQACDGIDANAGSALCAGDLKCRETGGGFFACVGRGNSGDLCDKAGAGKGSNDCGGKLVCTAPPYGAGPYTCQ